MSVPVKYDLNKPSEFKRLLRELESYMRVSLNDGTDFAGRKFAYDALVEINTTNEENVKNFPTGFPTGFSSGVGTVWPDFDGE